jgi:signal transduction histidine kinase
MIAAGDTTPEETRDYARIVLVATGRMTKIIQQLLQFARRTGPQKAPCDLRELTAAALELLRPLADKRGMRLELGPADVAATVLVDAGQFHQVVTNLVMNAVQAMQNAGSVHLELRVERVLPPADVTSAEGTYLCLRITDEGQGISPEDLPHIFEPFFTTKDVGEGTGLGLAVAYGIVREHGGWIGVESQLHTGTTFSVYLPVVGGT